MVQFEKSDLILILFFIQDPFSLQAHNLTCRSDSTNCSYVEDNNPCPLGTVASRCEELKMEKEFYVLWSLYLIFSGSIRWLFFQGRWICHCNWKHNGLLQTLVVLPWYVPQCYCITYDGVLTHGISKAVSHWSSATFPL